MGLREYFESDIRFYYAVGVFVILVYVTVIGVAVSRGLIAVDRRLVPFTVGFLLFMSIYFISVLVLRLEPDDV